LLRIFTIPLYNAIAHKIKTTTTPLIINTATIFTYFFYLKIIL